MREYFSHDYNTRQDKKIKALLRVHGVMGYGIYWAIVEDLYINNNKLDLDYNALSDDYKISVEIAKSVINDFDLFKIKDKIFFSASIKERLKKRDEKSEKARKSIQKRWNKDTNVLPTNYEGNTIKESKVKERKESKVNESIGSVLPIDELKTLYLSEANSQTRYALCSSRRIMPPTMLKWLDDFCNYLKGTNEHEKTFDDFCKHFNNWLGKKGDLNLKKGNESVNDLIQQKLNEQGH
jgi:hypothetical protein